MPAASDSGSISTKSSKELARAALSKYTGDHEERSIDGGLASLRKEAKEREKILEKQVGSKKEERLKDLGASHGGQSGGDDDQEEEEEEERVGSIEQGSENIAAKLKNKSAEEVFALFDKTDDGKLSFDEFQDMLPQLGFKLTGAKALKYFRFVDTDKSGEIDLDEFKTALFAIDPENGNPVGFAPNSLLTPMDAFQLFDEDNSGAIDEDEFFFLLKYLGVEVTEEKHEELFKKYDKDKSGFIEYSEFRKIWLHLANVKKELMDRGVKIPKFASQAALQQMLEKILDEEEELEAKAIAEATRWGKWQARLKHKRAAYQRSRRLADTELEAALDCAGAVYMLGSGAFNEFGGEAPRSFSLWGLACENWELISSMWKNRVQGRDVQQGPPTNSDMRSATDSDGKGDGHGNRGSKNRTKNTKDRSGSPFKGLCVAQNTVTMWGRRIKQVELADSCAFALSELGEIYAWGGKDHWHHEIRPESYWQTHWRGDTTERSQLLLNTTAKEEPIVSVDAEEEDMDDPEEAEIEKLRIVAEYYGVWKPPPSHNRLIFVKQELLSQVSIEKLRFSLEMRGKYPMGLNKTDLTSLLSDSLILERKTLGNLVHRQLRQMESDILALMKRKRKKQAKMLRLEMEKIWYPLREIEAEDAARLQAIEAAEREALYRTAELAYIAHRKKLDKARANFDPTQLSPRGTSQGVPLSGLTSRGGPSFTPRAGDATSLLAAGSIHAMLVHSNGDLYSWGTGACGRLGNDALVKEDIGSPAVVAALRGQPIFNASGGYNHSGAVAVGGALYMWGSGAYGKLGIGRCEKECYVATPCRVNIGRELGKKMVHAVSCGAAHSAAVTSEGNLWVWGCADGGRLGLGTEMLQGHSMWEPTIVEALLPHKMVGVSCGSTHTLCVSAVVEGRDRSPEHRKGGLVFQAGSAAALGFIHVDFERVKGLDGKFIRQVSAGHTHSAAISGEGELYCWGNNQGGCCGQPPSLARFVADPTLVSAFYVCPTNLALGCSARQSSIYAGRGADAAVDGERSGKGLQACICTQQDPQGWWEVDLGEVSSIYQVRLWNRWDVPDDASLDPELYRSRLFPAWILISSEPFGPEVGEAALRLNCQKASARIKLSEPRRCSTWLCPDKTLGRYVRVQMEGFDFLHFAQLEVMGNHGSRRNSGRVGSVCAGRYATAVTIRPSRDPDDLAQAYKRAIQSDPSAAEVLRQFDTYMPYYDKYGRGDTLHGCLLCDTGRLCDFCTMKHEFMSELKGLPLGPGGRLRRLDSMRDFLYGSVHDEENDNSSPAPSASERNNKKKKVALAVDSDELTNSVSRLSSESSAASFSQGSEIDAEERSIGNGKLGPLAAPLASKKSGGGLGSFFRRRQAKAQ